MNFISEAYSFAAPDGRVLLRACIDRPSNFGHIAFDYLNSYSNKIYEYTSEKLFLKATVLYNESQKGVFRFLPLLYTFKCVVTYSDDLYLSCLMIVKLTQAADVLSQSIDTVVLCRDKILPPAVICRNKRRCKLLLDSEGFPCVVRFSKGTVELSRVGKISMVK